MYRVGVFPGKFAPPHRGHINAIIHAGTQCEKLYVVVSHNGRLEAELYEGGKIKPISLKDKARWLSIELSDLEHIKVVMLDEDASGIPAVPYGWEAWSRKLNEVVGEPFDAIFGGEERYAEEGYTKYFPEVKYELYDSGRTAYPVSAAAIRNDPYKYWEYILGSARPYFAKRVLITGTESCGKTTLTKMLAKVLFTSWAQEEGRYYSARNMGGNELVFNESDFFEICLEQRRAEDLALRTANKIAFFDTDAVVTQYYCELYLGKKNQAIETMVDPNRYDVVLMLAPDVKWVPDGLRFKGEDKARAQLHEKLKAMYIERGFGDKIVEIGGNYSDRLNRALDIANQLIK